VRRFSPHSLHAFSEFRVSNVTISFQQLAAVNNAPLVGLAKQSFSQREIASSPRENRPLLVLLAAYKNTDLIPY
jgi:hypothetical protein